MTPREQDQADRAIASIGRGRYRVLTGLLLAAATAGAAAWVALSWLGARLRGWL